MKNLQENKKTTLGFASRAGHKLNHALETFSVSVEDKVCADLGSSTGGFVDCLLRRGAKKIYAVDTAYGELAWKLRNHDKVVVMERTNALHVELPENVEFISIDLGWTKLRKILPYALELLKPSSDIIALMKPHYEAPKSILKRGTVPEDKLNEVVKTVIEDLGKINIKVEDIVQSPIKGKRGGNIEYLLWIKN